MIIEFTLIALSLFSIFLYTILSFLDNKKNVYLILFSFLNLSAWMIYRYIITGHIPFSNIYESLIFFGFIYLIKILFLLNWNNKILSLILIPVELILIIALIMPQIYKIPAPLSPVLQSFWLLIHVPCFFIGYLSIFISFIMSIICFFIPMDNYIIKELKISYLFTCIGLITGALWADISWGIFWSWDTKEISALISIILLSLCFLFKSNRYRFIILILTLLSVIFTYFGVTFLLPGLHFYTK